MRSIRRVNRVRSAVLVTAIGLILSLVAGLLINPHYAVAKTIGQVVPTNIKQNTPNATPATTGLVSSNTCQQVVQLAFSQLQDKCSNMNRNSVCYGNNKVNADPVENVTLKFQNVGDIESIKNIKNLTTSAFDQATSTWGLSLLKLQADIPDTLPGQNVLFLVYGDTSIENSSGDMQSFYFSSGLGDPVCKEVPENGILVRSPNHTKVTFTANGVHITIASTILLTASPNKKMTVQLIEGHASVATSSGTQNLLPGQSVDVTLGGKTGLEPIGSPSTPVDAITKTVTTVLVDSLDQVQLPEENASANTKEIIRVIKDNVTKIETQVAKAVDATVKPKPSKPKPPADKAKGKGKDQPTDKKDTKGKDADKGKDKNKHK